MTQDDLEHVCEALALDACVAEERELYLTNFALMVYYIIGAAAPFLATIDECRTGLARHSQGGCGGRSEVRAARLIQ